MNNGLTFEEGITAGILKSRRPSGGVFHSICESNSIQKVFT